MKSFHKGSFTYYVITKGEGGVRNDYTNIIVALSSAAFDYGGGRPRGPRNRQKVIMQYVNSPKIYNRFVK